MHASSSIIGIFAIKFFVIDDFEEKIPLDDTNDIEVVVGRSKVAENLLVNIMFSFVLGFALMIMGMDIQIEQIIKVVR